MSWLLRVRDEARERLAAARESDDLPPERPESPGVVLLPAGEPDNESVPVALRVAAAWAWRLVIVAAVLYGLAHIISMLRFVVIPLMVALLLAALLEPAAGWLRKRGAPNALAATTILVFGLVFVFGTLYLVIQAFINGLQDLTEQVNQALNEGRDWLLSGPLHISQEQIDSYVDRAQKWLSENSSSLTSGALSTATTLGEVVTGFFLVLFTLFFFLKDGSQIWRFITRLLPRPARPAVRQAGQYSWHTLTSYVRATVFVAFVDAVGIGIGLAVLKVPLTLPLSALVFLGAFIPVIGATLSGAVAVAVALVTQGPAAALIILAVVIGVQQLEGHVLQPLIMGRAVALHPLAVILAIAIGITVAGIVGGLVAVPVLAVLNTAIRYLVVRPEGGPAPAGPDAPPGTVPTDDDQAAVEEARTDAVESSGGAAGRAGAPVPAQTAPTAAPAPPTPPPTSEPPGPAPTS
ncbi:AI-2E family transporter [Cryptosporangium aurantiacum]|uniref:Predicted PurR-regulated permease PerM n=1 Tax=Cryptosporangium aurantiacum TaxID=134849 RepID=A0A1M7RHM8_9ACTN|nr:AI-2E family transporter [Cryptosporangium aurantiacum]SHN45730.1 Predicted PurR-regulated permease PerM [Cryptosporangium aurantiacum]